MDLHAGGLLPTRMGMGMGMGLQHQQQHHYSSADPFIKSSDFAQEFSKESIKHTMLKQETTFKAQLVELHRLYGVQKKLMSEMKTTATATTISGVKVSAEKQQPLMMITGIKVSNKNTILYPKFDDLPSLRLSDVDCGVDLELSLSIGCGGGNRN